MAMNVVQLFISVLLYFVLFYGISFILNMILKMTWIMAVVYPVIVLWIIGRVSLFDYISSPGESFNTLWSNIIGISIYDIIILGSGLIGIILAGMTIRYLRKAGYQMF
ncbi:MULTISPECIES: YuiB family protein [Jeotgalicoccus]|uniref:YuiB family protein n=1 Tax=Jeotgalicoccus TaxID=227979 RepID=UPI0003FCB90A